MSRSAFISLSATRLLLTSLTASKAIRRAVISRAFAGVVRPVLEWKTELKRE
jgi:hypothetical protein